MPYGLIILGRSVALTLSGDDVQQLRLVDILQCAEHTYQFLHIVAIQLPEISEIQTLEEVTILQQALLDGIAHLLEEAQNRRHMRQDTPQASLETIIQTRRGHASQITIQSTRSLIDGHLVVVEDHQQFTLLLLAGVVQSLECQSTRHSTIANDGYNVVIHTLQLGGLSKTICCRNRG